VNSTLYPRFSRIRWVVPLTGLGYITLVCVVYFVVDLRSLHNWAEHLNGELIFILLAALPIFGLPVSVLYFIVGAKFGLALGLSLAACAILIHLLGIHWIGSGFLRVALRELLGRTRFRLPELPARGRTAIASLTALLPGPYSVKNYLLTIAGIPLKAFCLGCWPVYVIQASSAILFGDLSGRLTPMRGLLFVLYALAVMMLARYLVKLGRAETAERARSTQRLLPLWVLMTLSGLLFS